MVGPAAHWQARNEHGPASGKTRPAPLERLAAAWAAKWDGRWQYHVTDTGFSFGSDAGDDILVVAVQPTKTLAFAKGRYGQTRYLPPK